LLSLIIIFGFWEANHLAFNGDLMRDYAARFSDSKGVAPFRLASGAQGFAKYFQRIAWILQIFPRIPLAVL
jgi:hypothetical protein